jgi:hypothetical protein
MEQQEIRHHHRIHRHLAMGEQEEGECLKGKDGLKN